MDRSDAELVAAYRGGSEEALAGLVEKYRRPLFGYLAGVTGSQAEAEDVFQEVWFRVIRKVALYRERNFLGWLLRIAHNLVVDRFRRRRPEISLDQEPEGGGWALDELLPAGGPQPWEQLGHAELGRCIAAAVATLPEEQREVFLLRVEGGQSFKEIAALQGVSINTALARMHYALGKLRGLLKQEYGAVTAPGSPER